MDFIVLGFDLYFVAILGVSGLAKLASPVYFAETLRRQRIVPLWSIWAVSWLLPVLEITLALFLLVGLFPLWTGLVVFVLLLLFVSAEVALLVSHRATDCGCYGIAYPNRVDWVSVLVSVGLILLSLLRLSLSILFEPVNLAIRLPIIVLGCGAFAWIVFRMIARQRQAKRTPRAQFVSTLAIVIFLVACANLPKLEIKNDIAPSPTNLSSSSSDQGSASPLCKIIQAGTISGKVTQGGKRIPDGIFVNVIFEGGITEEGRTVAGMYEMPLLARQCGENLDWIGLSLWIGNEGPSILPDRPDFGYDMNLSEQAELFVPDTPTCKLVLGTVRGEVKSAGRAVPDGTRLNAIAGVGIDLNVFDPNYPLSQSTIISGGQFEIPSIGKECENREIHFLPMKIWVLDQSVEIMPSQMVTHIDVNIR